MRYNCSLPLKRLGKDDLLRSQLQPFLGVLVGGMNPLRGWREEATGLADAVEQAVDLLGRVVEVGTRPGQGRDAQHVHERLRTVVPRTDRDPVRIEQAR